MDYYNSANTLGVWWLGFSNGRIGEFALTRCAYSGYFKVVG